ncbi:MAG: AEC family transporter [Rickettsiaceae bacterium]|nr:AEC family transporter [Rickettsiaceae bacterium]
MSLFSLVFFKVLSSLLSVLMGYIAGKYSNVERDSIASLLFYFVAPVVFFAIPTSTKLTLNDMGITGITFCLCTTLSLFCYWLYGKIWQDSHRNILSLSSGTGNSGYVVLPVAAAVFDDYTLSIYALGLIGISLYEMSVGNYYCAIEAGGFKRRVLKVMRLPLINAFFLGCIMSLSGFKLPNFFDEFINNMKGAYSILGMLTIGLALAKITVFEFDWKFIGATFCSKFVFYPILFNIFILLDKYIFGYLDISYYNALQLLCIAPLAANTIVIASLYKMHPEKMATAVLLSLLFVLIYMPLMATMLLNDIKI